MKKITVLLSAMLMSAIMPARADEGMWLPFLIEQNMATMTAEGFKLTADDIYNINQACMKDAIVALDGGSCTASFVSSEGLLMTNHHCGYDEIQSHSTIDNDLLTNGFFANSKEEELPNPGKKAWLLVRVDDVTNRVLDAIPQSASESERANIVDSVSSAIIDEAVDETNYHARVCDMLYNNYYYLFIYEIFEDVRLVGAPPESVGKFGGDTDNWMWPRHTGDFSMFRVYCAPDGSPAEYSPDNRPYNPKHFLPISLDGYKEGDFAFVMGYPGSTSRYISSWETLYTIDANNTRINVRTAKQNIWSEYMNADEKTRLQYASKFAMSSNYWKYSIGQNKSLNRLHIIEHKQEIERDFSAWVEQDADRKAKYGEALSLIKKGVEDNWQANRASDYMIESQYLGCEAFRFAVRHLSLVQLLSDTDTDPSELEISQAKFSGISADFFKDYNPDIDKRTTKTMIKMFIKEVDPKFYPDYITSKIQGKYKGNVDKFVDDLFAKSMFCNQAKYTSFINNINLKAIAKDPIFEVCNSLYNQLMIFYDINNNGDLLQSEGMRLFVDGLMKMQPDKQFSPDANSTMRLTYGTVRGYKGADATTYDYFTTLDGVMEKEDSTNREFIVPQKLKQIYKAKDYGRYGNADGSFNVCFTTTNDITGGNSGSPVINGKGELIGLAFDGNWESMCGDITFEPELQRCIAVDIRYVLLIIDKYAGATNLINEMTLNKSAE